jgi:hypothetical protein
VGPVSGSITSPSGATDTAGSNALKPHAKPRSREGVRTLFHAGTWGSPRASRGLPCAPNARTNRIDEAAADGTRTWSTVLGNGGVTNFSWTGCSLLSSGTRYLTNRTPEGAMTIETYVNGRHTSTQQRNASGTQIARVSRTYDSHGRPKTATDDRNGTSTWDYYAGSDLLWKVTTPPSGTGDPSQTTVYEYDVAGRAWKVKHPDGGIVNTTCTPRGEVATTYGARSYPVEHTYDSQGRMKTLKTWQNKTVGTGVAVTTWTYHAYRGWLTAKKYEGRTTSVDVDYLCFRLLQPNFLLGGSAADLFWKRRVRMAEWHLNRGYCCGEL